MGDHVSMGAWGRSEREKEKRRRGKGKRKGGGGEGSSTCWSFGLVEVVGYPLVRPIAAYVHGEDTGA